MSGTDIYNAESFLDDEIMVLQSIYEDRLEITKDEKNSSTTLTIMLYPATADDASSQFVKLLLQLIVPNLYPDVSLDINIKSSRGLSEDHLENLLSNLKKHAAESVGTSVIFDLIEMTKDSLTFNNIPSCPCPICLEMFQAFHDFVKTECFHYLHSYCMHEYVIFQKKLFRQSSHSHSHHKPRSNSLKDELTHVPCPVCREDVMFDMEMLSNAKKPVESEQPVMFNLTKIKKEVNELGKIYDRQKKVGGIIDLEAEKKKHLISSIEQSNASGSSGETSISVGDDNNATEGASLQSTEETKKEKASQPTLKLSDKRMHHRRSDRYFRNSEHGGRKKETDGEPLGNNVNVFRELTKNRFPFHGKQTLSEHQKQHNKPDRYNSSYKRMDRGRGKTLSTRHSGYKPHEEYSTHKQSQKNSQTFKTDNQPGINEQKQTNHRIKPPPGFS